MSQGFTQPPGGAFGSSSGGFSGGQSGFGGGSQSGGFDGQSGGFGGGSGGFNQGLTSPSFSPAPAGSSEKSGGGKPGRRSSGGGGRLQSAPVQFLLPGLILAVASIGLNAWITFGAAVATDGSFFITAGIAWALAGIAGVVSVGWYLAKLNERKAEGFYTDIPWKKMILYVTVILLIGAVVWSAFDIALWAGKRSW